MKMTPEYEKELLNAVDASFGDDAASAGVPLEVVMSAAAHTFAMLDVDQQVELIEEALARWTAARATAKAVAGAFDAGLADPNAKEVTVQVGDTTLVYSKERNQMRDDLIYKLMHQRFDVIYAVAVRLTDAPEGPEHQQWLMTPPRPTEDDTPRPRVVVALKGLIETLRKARQRVESMERSARIGSPKS